MKTALVWLRHPWAGWIAAALLLAFLLFRPTPAPVPVIATAGAAGVVKPSRQIVRVPYPVPGSTATVYIDVIQECPEVAFSATATATVTTVTVDCLRRSWAIAGGAGVRVGSTGLVYTGSVGHRLAGPLWMDVWATTPPWIVGALVRVEF
jgi:hypothetical protein